MTNKQELFLLLKYYLAYLVIASLLLIPLLASLDGGYWDKMAQWTLAVWVQAGFLWVGLLTCLFVVIGGMIAMDGV